MKKYLCFLFAITLMISSISFTTYASSVPAGINVNGKAFSGTLSEAIASAGSGGTVEISGTVYTYPVGKRDGCYINDVTIQGVNNAKLILDPLFMMAADDNLDVLSIKGHNVTVKDITIDATLRVDYPVCVFCGTDNITLDNVTVLHGIRGGVNVMTSGRVLFKNVHANNSIQCGFEFENCEDASSIVFDHCSTSGNWYKTGILLVNGYGPCKNVNASGLTCYEDCFGFHDRVAGTIGGGKRQDIILTAPPKNSKGEPIETDYAMYYPVEKAYQHIRFGVSKSSLKTAAAKVETNKYGMNTVIYFDDLKIAQANASSGGKLTELHSTDRVFTWILRIFNSIKVMI